jgi:L-arabinokinase
VITSSVPERLLSSVLGRDGVEYRNEECDVGLVQRGALAIDEAASLARWRAFTVDWRERVEREAAWLTSRAARLVLCDVPPLGFAAAARAGIPSVGLANFSWDWIYGHLARRDPGWKVAAEWAGEAYSSAGLLLRLPFAGDLSVFPRIEDVPLIARRPRQPAGETRRRLRLEGGEPLVLWSFGGHGMPGFSLETLGRLEGYRFVLTGNGTVGAANVTTVDEGRLEALELGYVDLVAAADVVVTKPGYGIVTDCIAARTAMVYTERGDFPEYPILVREMTAYLPAAHVSNAELLSARLEAPLASALGVSWPPAPPALDGADVVAARVSELVGVSRA